MYNQKSDNVLLQLILNRRGSIFSVEELNEDGKFVHDNGLEEIKIIRLSS